MEPTPWVSEPFEQVFGQFSKIQDLLRKLFFRSDFQKSTIYLENGFSGQISKFHDLVRKWWGGGGGRGLG